MSDKFYVYEHWRTDRNECFYVGKGTGCRATGMKARNRHHLAIQAKLSRMGGGVEVKIIETGMAEEAAYALEAQRISWWKSNGNDLANIASGGSGAPGRKLSEENIEKLRASRIGTKHSAEALARMSAIKKGKPNTEIQKQKISASLMGIVRNAETRRKMSESSIGKKMSPEACRKMSEYRRGRRQSQEVIEKRRLVMLASWAIGGKRRNAQIKKSDLNLPVSVVLEK